ncbi:MAG: TIGR03643 family protein, partial [Psychrobacter alimentarius]
MASYQDLAAVDLKDQSSDSSDSESTLATMQADMDAALKDKQHADIGTNSNEKLTSSVQSSDMIEQSMNESGNRVLDEAQ